MKNKNTKENFVSKVIFKNNEEERLGIGLSEKMNKISFFVMCKNKSTKLSIKQRLKFN